MKRSSSPTCKPRWGSAPVLIAGALVGVIPLIAGLLPGDAPARLNHLIVGYGLAALPFMVVWRCWRGLEVSRRGLIRLLLIAVGVRLALLALPPLLSEDIWRYVWDGATQWAGLNPYQHAPNAAAVDPVATSAQLQAVRAAIGHAQIPTIYPPAAQIAFAATGVLGPDPVWLRLLFIGCDGLAILGLWRWAEASDRPPQLAALYAFAPPAVLESAVGGHLDAMGVAAMIWAGAWLAQGRGWRAGWALGWSISTKLLPLIVLPTLVLRRRWRTALAALLLAGATVVPYADVGQDGLKGLGTYAARWRANDGAFAVFMAATESIWPPGPKAVPLPPERVRWVRALAGPPPHGDATKVWPDEIAFAAAKATTLLLLGGVGLIALVRARDFAALLGPCIGALLLLAPVVHPWYLLWVLPFAALAAHRARWPAVFWLWSALIWLAYLPRPTYLRTGEWAVAPWTVWAQYAPVWFVLVLCAMRAVQRDRPS